MLRKLRQRVRTVMHRRRCERELDVELQFHLDMLTAQHVQRGLAPDAARRAARQAFGPAAGVKDGVRDTWLSRWLETAGQDVRHGLRTLRAAPAFAAGAILTIALAVGANAAIFGITYAILLEPPPFRDPSRLIVLRHGTTAAAPAAAFSIPELADYGRMPSVESIAELHTMWFILLGGAEPQRVSTGVVSTNYFDLLGVTPLMGRSLAPADDRAGAEAVLLLSYEYWTRGFNRDPAIVGRLFEMNDRPHRVVGVLPPIPQYPEAVDVYMPPSACPFRATLAAAPSRTSRMVQAIARIRADAPVHQLDADIVRTAADLRATHPAAYSSDDGGAGRPSSYSASATPLVEEMRTTLRPALLLLMTTAGLVLLIACVSVSNLMLARLTQRASEVSLRAALGATRFRLVRQLLTENTAVAVLGAALGLVLAGVALDALTVYVQRGTTLLVPRGLTGAAAASAIGLSVAMLLVATLVPLLRRQGLFTPESPRLRPGSTRHGLIVGQVCLSFVLLVAAALSVRSLLHLQGIDTGFTTEHVQTFRLDLNFSRYRDYASISAFWRQFEQSLTASSGVSAAGGAGSVPLDGRPLTSLAIQVQRDEPAAGEPPRDGAPHAPRANLRVASPGYFAALGQRVVEGRTFTRADNGAEAMGIVINQSLARKHWPAGGAVGQRMRVQAASATVVGVVEDTRQALDQPASDEIYLPLLFTMQLSTNWLVRSALPSDRIERQVRDIIRSMDPTQPVDNFRSLESFRADLLMPSRVIATVIGLFAALALTITGTGIAGVVGFAVQHRRREFGVRLALGAPRHRVVGMVLADAMRLVLTGLAMGVLGSIVAFPFLRARLTGIETLEVLPVAVVSAVLLGVAAGAAFVPARRAATVDPMITLRVN